MKLLRTIRFDISDTFVFGRAAEPDEWAVPGTFAFAHLSHRETTGKLKQAFSNGFLGTTSFGHATFATVSAATSDDRRQVEAALALHLIDRYGAPTADAAHAAAREELDFVLDLARDADINTVFAIRRSWNDDGSIKEELRALPKPSVEDQHAHAQIWSVVDDGA